MALLEHMNGPEQLRDLNSGDIAMLCQDVRDMIADVVFENGGHLASSLGAVELTVSLLRQFDPLRDRIVFDVGHQTYPYKILTDRRDQFATIRRFGGLSGYPKRSESPYDHFDVGHSSTSLSAVLGYAKARDILGQDHHVVAVIGDGAIINGMAFEALNHLRETDTKVIYILNDNAMSISPRVGGVATHFAHLSANPYYLKLKKAVKDCCKGLPKGETIEHILGRAKDQIKSLVKPDNLFDSLDIAYWGPFDGHSVEEMDLIFTLAKQYDKSVLIHLITQKGRGLLAAEENPSAYHGVSPASSKSKPSSTSWSQAVADCVLSAAESDPRVVLLTPAMKEGSKLGVFARRFPDRFFDVGIAEEHSLTLAAGMAAGGLRPVVSIYSTFLQRAMDQLALDICLQDLPVVLTLDRAGMIGEDGETHQGLFDMSWTRTIPNLVVQAPRDRVDLARMMDDAMERSGPTAIRFPRGAVIESLHRETSSEKGALQAEVIFSSEGAVWYVGVGKTVAFLSNAREEAIRQGYLAPGLVDLRTISPLDWNVLDPVLSLGGVVLIAEDGYLEGGVGEAIAARAAEIGSSSSIHRMGVHQIFMPHGTIDEQWRLCGMTIEKAVAVCGENTERKTG
ncbi:MAG: 1-deoxy-D-xylulose-5-phosphate synthase [Dethiosulfovibrio peptidovorans]|nr:MAG: 1-deoxy-D-xylulose-5-phosphate synthase [Dethiosulfovibrio peptidovorans]